MSHNQSRAEGNQSTQNRKSGRPGSSSQQRNLPGNSSNKGGVAAALTSSGSFKKHNNNAKGGQSRAGTVSLDSSTSPEAYGKQNGSNQLQPNNVSNTSANVKPNAPPQKITQVVPRGPPLKVSTVPSHVSTASSEFKAPATPSKGDTSASFPLQFGSITPGFMNGIQIPARTSSAPPNLDEQKRDQARRDSLRSTPAMPTPSIPKQQLPKKDAGVSDLPNAVEPQTVSKLTRDAQVSSAPPLNQSQRPSVHPTPGMSMQIQFHQPHVPVQFGGPNPQIQSQAMTGTSMPMSIPMALPLGNSPVQQPMFVSGLPPHPMQSQGMMHQGQNLNFSSALGPQLPSQLGNMGINMVQQFPQQQAGKYVGLRRTVKITHPETHEELRLDGSPVPRSNPNVPSQSQPIPSFPHNHQMNYYPNSYNSSSVFFHAPNSVPMNSTQAPLPQPPRFYNQVKQVTVKPPGRSHGEKDSSPSASLLSVGKGEYLKPSRLHGEHSVGPHKGVEPSSSISLQQSKPGLGTSSTTVPMASEEPSVVSGPFTVESALISISPSVSETIDVSASSSTNSAEEAEKEAVVGLESIKDKQEKKGNSAQLDQVGKQSSSVSSLPSQVQKYEPVEAKVTSLGASQPLQAAKESTSITTAAASEYVEGNTSESSEVLGIESTKSRQSEPEKVGIREQGEGNFSESSKPEKRSLETSLKSLSLKPTIITGNNKESSSQEVTSTSCGGCSVETAEKKLEESSGRSSDDARIADDLVTPTLVPDGANPESSVAVIGISAQYDRTCTLDASFSVPDVIHPEETTAANSATSCQEFAPPSAAVLKLEDEDTENNSSVLLPSPSGFQEKSLSEPVAKNVTKIKKKKKELYRKAEAAGTSSDLYMAYKGPEEKKENVTSAENTASKSPKQTSTDGAQSNAMSNVKPSQSKAELDDWEDAADISTPKLETPKNENEINGADDNGLTTKNYSRDFLFKFAAQCTELPHGFEVTSDIDDALLVSGVGVLHESYPSPGRNIDRSNGGSRSDRRGNGMGGDDKWNKLPEPLMLVRGDMRMDIGYSGNNVIGFRPGQGGNYGVLRTPRPQTPGQYTGGIFSGPTQSPGMQGGVQRNSSDSDRWQRGTAFQKGLMPSPQTPLQVMHKAEKKYEIGKVSDEEEAKQRQLKAILNKLTPQNFEKLFEQVKKVNIDNVITLSGVISQIFDKALTEPTFCEMYADFCFHLAAELPDLSIENERITFKRLLLNKCQIEFERGEREEEEANKADEEGEAKQSEAEREDKRLKARRRMLGNIRLIGELYKKRMLTERIMHECIKKLLGQCQNPDEEDIEALCKLMSTIGEIIDHPKAKEHMDVYFDMMGQLSNNKKLSSRLRFMLKDAIDLRKNKWQQRRKVEGPKKIEEVHRDAAQERQTQSSRLARAPSIGTSVRRGPSIDFAPRGSNMFSSSSQMGGIRAVSPQLRGYGSQDARLEERHSFENRTTSVPLPQRLLGDDSITLGPQGGLARGMAFRGQPTAPSIHLAEMPSPGEARRMGSGLNGYSSVPERATYSHREDIMPKHMPVRFASPTIYDQSHQQERNMTYENIDNRNIDRNFDRSLASPPTWDGPINSMQNSYSEKVLPEDRLHDKSMLAIKEFYSAKDENEVALCIKELKAPSFYPSMISIWITDSFERRDMERDLLTKLLINLANPQDGMLSPDQFVKGFESVLAVLEDSVSDAPRAAEFLGRIFAKVILEDIVSLSEIGRLIYEGGEEQGRLVETGLAAEVLGTILETIKTEKGDSTLSDIRSTSNLQLENFKPPGSHKSWRIDKFL